MKAALTQLDKSIVIPVNWRPYHAGSLVSFQASPAGSGDRSRVVLESNPDGTNHVFITELPDDSVDLQRFSVDLALFRAAIGAFPKACTLPPERPLEDTKDSWAIDLDERLPTGFTWGMSLQEWCDRRLTKAQKKFVDFPLTRPVRLRGAAGTGKTIALIIKALVEYRQRYKEATGLRIAFLTHSSATTDLVRMIMDAIGKDIPRTADNSSALEVRTLQDLANRAMSYNLAGLEPLSNDGLEGRRLQIELIESIVGGYVRSTWLTQKARCSEPFRRYMEADPRSVEARYFYFEVMNEFACVLDADGVRDSAERQGKYLKENRKNWMMHLDTDAERRVILDLYRLFRAELRDLGVIGVDQMMADFLGYLDSNRWDSIRRKDGYDAVFVDELHLFNRQERMVFHHLMRNPKDVPIVVMAYDTKQSPRDTFVGISGADNSPINFWKDANLGEVASFELVDVFRYTPEIAKFLDSIDASFPAVDLTEEWPKYEGRSQLQSGPIPRLTVMPDQQSMYDRVFDHASKLAKQLKRGRRVAVLCVSTSTFDTYLKAGKYAAKFLALTSRDEVSQIANAGNRFIYSMPEYVAGLQFDTVLLMDVNRAEVPEGPHAVGAKRRFVSAVYLGASRAESNLELFSRDDAGGPSSILDRGLMDGSLVRRT
jgi:hypothetical protein